MCSTCIACVQVIKRYLQCCCMNRNSHSQRQTNIHGLADHSTLHNSCPTGYISIVCQLPYRGQPNQQDQPESNQAATVTRLSALPTTQIHYNTSGGSSHQSLLVLFACPIPFNKPRLSDGKGLQKRQMCPSMPCGGDPHVRLLSPLPTLSFTLHPIWRSAGTATDVWPCFWC